MIKGMMISGFVVRATKYVEHEPLSYGLFPTVEAAEAWAEKMISQPAKPSKLLDV